MNVLEINMCLMEKNVKKCLNLISALITLISLISIKMDFWDE